MSTSNCDNELANHGERSPSWSELLSTFLYLGSTNIGGPATQTARMHRHIVDRKHWLSSDRFERAVNSCNVLPGSQLLQLAIFSGYLKKKYLGGLLAGLIFILPGAILMFFLARLYVVYSQLPKMALVLFILKPAVLGIITAGTIKLGASSIRNFFLAAIGGGAFVALNFAKMSLLPVLLAAGLLNLLVSAGLPRRQRKLSPTRSFSISAAILLFLSFHPHWLRLSWLFLKTGLFSFGGAFSSLAFLHQGAVEDYRWLSPGQLLDGVALSVATPGPFMLLSTFVGHLSGGTQGALLATFFVFLPSFLFVLGGSRYFEKQNSTEFIQPFLDGTSAALVGVMIVVTIQVAPEVLLRSPTVVIAIASMLMIVLWKVDVAIVAAVAIIGGVLYAFLA
jgi:chromate transporter